MGENWTKNWTDKYIIYIAVIVGLTIVHVFVQVSPPQPGRWPGTRDGHNEAGLPQKAKSDRERPWEENTH